MGFFDKVKNVANDAVNAVSDAAKDVTDGAKEMNEKAKINRAIKAEEAKINNLYVVIGEKLFNSNSSAPSGFEDQFSGINAAKIEIERLKKNISDIEAASKCPKCGSKINSTQKFCQSCGMVVNSAPQTPTSNPVSPQVVETTANEVPTEQSNFIPSETDPKN